MWGKTLCTKVIEIYHGGKIGKNQPIIVPGPQIGTRRYYLQYYGTDRVQCMCVCTYTRPHNFIDFHELTKSS